MSPDAPSERLEQEIAEASDALLRVAGERDDWVRAFELKDQARNGWSAGAMNIAFRRLVKDHTFEIDGDLIRIRLHQ